MRALERHDALSMRLAVCKFALIAAVIPILCAAARLTAKIPLAIVLFKHLAGARPLQTSRPLSQAILASTRPTHRFVAERMRIEDPATAVGIGDKAASRTRLPIG
jgi:hypothetical protein